MAAFPLFQSLSETDASITDQYSDTNRTILHQGETQAFLKTLPAGIVSLIVTSPPYNIGKSYERKQSINAAHVPLEWQNHRLEAEEK